MLRERRPSWHTLLGLSLFFCIIQINKAVPIDFTYPYQKDTRVYTADVVSGKIHIDGMSENLGLIGGIGVVFEALLETICPTEVQILGTLVQTAATFMKEPYDLILSYYILPSEPAQGCRRSLSMFTWDPIPFRKLLEMRMRSTISTKGMSPEDWTLTFTEPVVAAYKVIYPVLVLEGDGGPSWVTKTEEDAPPPSQAAFATSTRRPGAAPDENTVWALEPSENYTGPVRPNSITVRNWTQELFGPPVDSPGYSGDDDWPSWQVEGVSGGVSSCSHCGASSAATVHRRRTFSQLRVLCGGAADACTCVAVGESSNAGGCSWEHDSTGRLICGIASGGGTQVACGACPLQDKCPQSPSEICAQEKSPCSCAMNSIGCLWSGDDRTCVHSAGGGTLCRHCSRQPTCDPPRVLDVYPTVAVSQAVDGNTKFLHVTFDRPIQLLAGDPAPVSCLCENAESPLVISAPRLSVIPGNILQIDGSDTRNAEWRTCALMIGDQVVSDNDGVQFLGLSPGLWSFWLGDTMKPDIVSYSPKNGAGNVGLDVIVTMTFTENVVITPIFKLSLVGLGKGGADRADAVFHTFLITSSEVSAVDDTVTVALSGYLAEGTTYALLINLGGISDRASNAFDALSQTGYTFTTLTTNVVSAAGPDDWDVIYWTLGIVSFFFCLIGCGAALCLLGYLKREEMECIGTEKPSEKQKQELFDSTLNSLTDLAAFRPQTPIVMMNDVEAALAHSSRPHTPAWSECAPGQKGENGHGYHNYQIASKGNSRRPSRSPSRSPSCSPSLSPRPDDNAKSRGSTPSTCTPPSTRTSCSSNAAAGLRQVSTPWKPRAASPRPTHGVPNHLSPEGHHAGPSRSASPSPRPQRPHSPLPQAARSPRPHPCAQSPRPQHPVKSPRPQHSVVNSRVPGVVDSNS